MPDIIDQIAAEDAAQAPVKSAPAPGRGGAAPDIVDQIHAEKLSSQGNIQRFAQSWWDNSVLKHPIDSAVGLVKSLVTMPDYHQLSQQEKDAVDAEMEKAWNDAASNIRHPTPEYAGMVTSKGTNAAIIAGATYGVGKGLGAAVDAAPHAWEATKAGISTAAPDVAKGAGTAAASAAIAHYVPGGAAINYAAGMGELKGATQAFRGLVKGFQAGKNAWADSVAERMTAKAAAAREAAEAAAPPTWQPGPPGTPEPPPPPEHWEPYTAPGAAPPQWEPYTAPAWEPGPAGTPAPRASAWEPYEAPLKAEHIEQYDAAAAKPEAKPAGDIVDQIHAEAAGEPDARATLSPELQARVEQLRAETHTPEELERARLADAITQHQAYSEMTALDREWTARGAKADHIAEFVLRHNLEQTPTMYAKVADELGYDKPPSEDAQAMIADRLEWFRARHPALAPAAAETAPASIGQMEPRAVSAAAPDLEQQLRDSLAARGVAVPEAAAPEAAGAPAPAAVPIWQRPASEVGAMPAAEVSGAPTAAATAPRAPEPGTLAKLSPDSIKADPVRFQFKRETGGASGTGDKLKNVSEYNPDLGGILNVWHDPADGQTYVVNGHHRLELAQRAGAPSVDVRYIDAADATEARAKGALINIAEDQGTPLDAAKLFRDTGITPADLKAKGIALNGKVARAGLGLANLDQSIFDQVISGDIPTATASTVGEMLPGRFADQRAVMDAVDKAAARGKPMTPAQISESIRVGMRPGNEITETQDTLFGSVSQTRSLFNEIGEISDYVRKQLSQEKRTFGGAASNAAAELLGKAGNVINAGENLRIAGETGQAQAVYDKLSGMSGPVSDALADGARELANGANANEVKARTYNAVRRAISETLGGTKTGIPGGLPPRDAGGLGETPAPSGDLFSK